MEQLSETSKDFLECYRDKHPKSYKHYTFTINPVGAMELLFSNGTVLDAVTTRLVNSCPKGTVATWINEISDTGKDHIHGVISMRKAPSFQELNKAFEGYQLYLTKLRHPLDRETGAAPEEYIVRDEQGKPIGIAGKKNILHPFKNQFLAWIFYVSKNSALQNKKIKHYRKV